MMAPEAQGGSVVIKLNRKFYDRESIDESIREFSDVFSASIVEGDCFAITITPKPGITARNLGPEFCNHVLAAMKNKNLV
jgi:hypothetical protein